ncbi:uncharacterized protein LOC135468988 [Liolophura sinensis]|uniref:uncharacterized protein LOC135468988 n=1 Tax=Liolophura sinensis TaxID=3198878 RepID=UPI0031595930
MATGRIVIVICLVVTCISLGIGVIIGYFVREGGQDLPRRDRRACGTGSGSNIPQIDRFLESCQVTACRAETCDIPLPRSYVAYHLKEQTIAVDGDLNDPAWEEVPWTEKFVDLRGTDYPKPLYDTRVKIRWDDTHLYVGAYLQDEHVWANKTKHDSHVFNDNAFEIFVDVDGSTHNYKEIEINALGTIWDLMLTKAYIDGGRALSNWESDVEKAILVDGNINDPDSPNKFWTVEMKFPLSRLRSGTTRDVNSIPRDKETWRMVLARSHWAHKIVDGQYVKDESKEANWWSWQPHGAVSLHLPDRWGLLQLSRDTPENFQFTPSALLPVKQALFDSFKAMKSYYISYGVYTTNVDMLELPPYIVTGECVGKPTVVPDRGALYHQYTITGHCYNPARPYSRGQARLVR